MLSVAMLLIVAALQAAPIEARYPQTIEVFRCDFEEAWDRNFDAWPDQWSRRKGQGYPHFVQIGLCDTNPAEGRSCLEIRLDGGAAMLSSPPIEIRPLSSYVLELQISTSDLVHNEAYASLAFLDERQQLLETQRTVGLSGTDTWRKVRLGPIATEQPLARYVIIELHLEPRREGDLKGSARFDDVWLGRLPRLAIETSHPINLFTRSDQVQLTCLVSDFTNTDAQLVFTLTDAMGKEIDRAERPMPSKASGSKSTAGPRRREERPEELVVPVPWSPRVPGPGFYRAHACIQDGNRTILENQVSLAVIEPPEVVPGGEFGWSLPQAEGPLSLPVLTQLLPQAGISWVKFPVWYSDKDSQRMNAVMRFVERMGAQHIEVVGLLCNPPPELREKFGKQSDLSAADLFTPGPEVWYPELEPVMTRLSLKIRWWQLGTDQDTSFVGYRQLPEKIAEIKKQLDRIGQDLNIGFGWRWMDQFPSEKQAAWTFVSLSANPPLTAHELSDWMSATAEQRSQRWIVVEPLPREDYRVEIRIADLVTRLVAAKVQGAKQIFIPDPINSSRGLLNDDGTPGELLPTWLTCSSYLTGAQYLGSVQLPGGSHNALFARGKEAVLVVWHETPTRETIDLGEELRLVDVWGQTHTPPRNGSGYVIDVNSLPVFLAGIPLPVAATAMSLSLEKEQLPSVLGAAHVNRLRLRNAFPRGAGGKILLNPPDGWTTTPREIDFKLAAGEKLNTPFDIVFPYDVNSGQRTMRFDVQLNADRPYQFSVYREVTVGLGDLMLEANSEMADNGELLVTQRLTNLTDQKVSFKCDLHAANRRRLRSQVLDLDRGDDVQVYRVPAGQELIGQTLWIRAEEINGLRVLSFRFTAEK